MEIAADSGTPPGVDVTNLRAFLREAAPDLATADLRAELISGGRSNLTYFIRSGDRTVVLRRPPLGHVLATAHDMAREYRVISALADTDVPVPTPILICDDPSVVGASFYLMEKAPGSVLRTYDDAMELGPANIPNLANRLVHTLGQLHAIDPDTIGLSDFGRPDGFLARQVARWTKQLEASRSRDLPGMDALIGALNANQPTTQRSTIVHGDYRLDNVIVHQGSDGECRISAVVDWEMSTLGDPLTDIGLFCTYWAGMGSETLIPLSDDVDAPPPFPPTADLINGYAEASGLDLADLPWYVAFGCFKLAVILEGIHYRHSLGQTVGDGFETLGDMVQPLVQRGLAQLR